jgi:hypothetical protein
VTGDRQSRLCVTKQSSERPVTRHILESRTENDGGDTLARDVTSTALSLSMYIRPVAVAVRLRASRMSSIVDIN